MSSSLTIYMCRVSSVGRAGALQASGRWFEPGTRYFWSGGREAYCDSLENCRSVKRSVGSNPTHSLTRSKQRIKMRINWETVISTMVGFFAIVGLIFIITIISGEAKVNVTIDEKSTDMASTPITSTSEMTANEN